MIQSLLVILTTFLGFFPVPISFSQEQKRSTPHQAVAEDQKIKCTVSVVVITVEVMGTEGDYISNLGLEEFTVYEDGEKQKIDFFSREEEPDIATPRTKYTLGYFPTDLKPDGEPRRLRIKVRKWKTKGYEVKYSPQWYFPMFDEVKYSPTWYLPKSDD